MYQTTDSATIISGIIQGIGEKQNFESSMFGKLPRINFLIIGVLSGKGFLKGLFCNFSGLYLDFSTKQSLSVMKPDFELLIHDK